MRWCTATLLLTLVFWNKPNMPPFLKLWQLKVQPELPKAKTTASYSTLSLMQTGFIIYLISSNDKVFSVYFFLINTSYHMGKYMSQHFGLYLEQVVARLPYMLTSDLNYAYRGCTSPFPSSLNTLMWFSFVAWRKQQSPAQKDLYWAPTSALETVLWMNKGSDHCSPITQSICSAVALTGKEETPWWSGTWPSHLLGSEGWGWVKSSSVLLALLQTCDTGCCSDPGLWGQLWLSSSKPQLEREVVKCTNWTVVGRDVEANYFS